MSSTITIEGKGANRRRSELSAHAWALLGYFTLALVVTYPVVLHFTTDVPGDLIADRNQNLWNLWWVGQAISRVINPFHTDMLYHPYGVSLYYHTLGLPQGLIGLVPQALWGLPAAYNTVLLFSFTLSGYGAFRLARLYTDRPFAAFLGGVVFAFTPYTLDALKGQLEVLSTQWIPFYAEAWLRAGHPDPSANRAKWKRYAPPTLAGVFLALAAYSSLYYALYLLIFTVAHVLYMAIKRRRSGTRDNSKLKTMPSNVVKGQNSKLIMLVAVALALTSPLLLGLASNRNDPRLEVKADPAHRLAHSADLLSFFAPPHDHPLLSSASVKPGVEEPPIHDYLSLGYVALALALLGACSFWKDQYIRFWALLGIFALVLSMGPQLQMGGNLTGIPLPFKLIEGIPGIDAIAKPERLVVLARLCMGVLAACGAAHVIDKLASHSTSNPQSAIRNPQLKWVALLALLLVELPIHPRYMEPLPNPTAWVALAHERPDGALMELPFATQQVEVVSNRMLAQTTHGRPIMSGYLSRNYNSPIIDSCSPFWGFISPLDVPTEGHEIAAPLVASRPSDVLNFFNIRYIALDSRYASPDSPSLDPKERAAYLDILSHVADASPLTGGDVEIYHVVNRDMSRAEPAFHIGSGWYKAEDVGGKPFRWLKESEASLCVFAPHATKAPLVMEGTAFGRERQAQLLAGGKTLYNGTLPEGGRFAPVTTGPVYWPPGVTEVRIVAKEPAVTPRSLDPTTPDERLLRIGFRSVRLETLPQK